MIRLNERRNEYAAKLFERIKRHSRLPADFQGIRQLAIDLDFIALWELTQEEGA